MLTNIGWYWGVQKEHFQKSSNKMVCVNESNNSCFLDILIIHIKINICI